VKLKITAAIVLTLLFLSASAGAIEWTSKLGISARGPFWVPLFKGSSYHNLQGSYEPYMMGWDGVFEIKYGVPKSFIVNLSIGYVSTYDDTTATTDQSFKMNNSNNAFTKLSGFPIGLTGQYYFLPEGDVQPYLLGGVGIDLWTIKTLGIGQALLGSKYKFTDLVIKGGAGINFWLSENLAIDLQGKLSYGLANLSKSGPLTEYGDLSNFKNRPFGGYIEPSIGITYYFGGSPDTDGDGIKDKFDQCPDTPKGATVDQYGCPLDSDGDGVYDGIDTCASTPKNCIVDIVGCPIDSDNDGVCDGIDKCPDTPKDVAVDVKGCPLDTDGDGVPDFKDQELNTQPGATVDVNGVAIDSDKDGVPDGIDRCPDTPPEVMIDEFGCPKAKPLTAKLTLNIQYETGSFEPDAAAKLNLDELVTTMQAYPNLKIAVNGYTDALGSASGNLKLSQKRADAIRDYLVAKGVASERVTSKGFGEDNPIADNGTPDGRQQNRRIEIVPVE
jgi:outer membrane protein OmpA-like peptidoglycan-associated protein